MVNGVFTACLCSLATGEAGSDSEGLGALVWLIGI